VALARVRRKSTSCRIGGKQTTEDTCEQPKKASFDKYSGGSLLPPPLYFLFVKPTFDTLSALRAEPALEAALGAGTEREMTALAEFLQDGIVNTKLARSDDAPAPSRPYRGQRVAA
jgi:hypothetical protein